MIGAITTILVIGVTLSLSTLSNLENTEKTTYLISEDNGMSRFVELEYINNNVINFYEETNIDFERLGIDSEEGAQTFIDNYENKISPILETGIIQWFSIGENVIIETVTIYFEHLDIDSINQWFDFKMPKYNTLEYLLDSLKEEGMEIVEEDVYYSKWF